MVPFLTFLVNPKGVAGVQKVLIGEILRPHGVQGEVKVYPITTDVRRFAKLKQVFLQKGSDDRSLEIQRARIQDDFVYLHFAGVNNMDEAEKLRGFKLYIDRAEVPPLEEGWYYFELEGMQVYEGDVCLGKLTHILETGANDVYVVQGAKGEICIPALKSVVKNVDVAGRRMDVELPPGLLDD